MGPVQHLLGRIVLLCVVCGVSGACLDEPNLIFPSEQPDQSVLGPDTSSNPSGVEIRLEPGAGGVPVGGQDPAGSLFVVDCDDLPLADLIGEPREAFTPTGILRDRLEPCQVPAFRGVASAGMDLQVDLVPLDPLGAIDLVRFDARSVRGGYLEETQRVGDPTGRVQVTWTAAYTGEYVLVIDAADRDVGGEFQLAVRCQAGCDRSMTRFPIVLMHGMAGTDSYFGILDYFFGVEEAMEESGFDVRITVVNPLAHSRIRAGELVGLLEAIMEESGARKVNLIGHSQGGLDGRILLSELGFGEHVASFTSIATPHHGSPIADFVVGLLTSNKITETLAEEVVDTVASLFGESEPHMADQLRELTRDYMENEFNPTHPDDPRVAYYSWAGRTCALVELDCQEEWNGEIVIPFLVPTYWANFFLGAEENDGLVPVESAIWGTFLGVLPADHYDQVGQLADTANPSFDHIEFFLSEGQRLFESGF
ncbi:MAG: alpha/beta fold hydrolase [Bradymonadales bacterium]|nr:alpha/beta fold hydrolase [Bradymonadales bacterium]